MQFLQPGHLLISLLFQAFLSKISQKRGDIVCKNDRRDWWYITKVAIGIRKSNDIQHNGQTKNDKRPNNDLQNNTQQTKDRARRTLLKMGKLRCSGRVSCSCSTSGTRSILTINILLKIKKNSKWTWISHLQYSRQIYFVTNCFTANYKQRSQYTTNFY